jgi:hypothetical protein
VRPMAVHDQSSRCLEVSSLGSQQVDPTWPVANRPESGDTTIHLLPVAGCSLSKCQDAMFVVDIRAPFQSHVFGERKLSLSGCRKHYCFERSCQEQLDPPDRSKSAVGMYCHLDSGMDFAWMAQISDGSCALRCKTRNAKGSTSVNPWLRRILGYHFR